MVWKLYEGDCFDHFHHIEDHTMDMILCDLPYGTTACKWDTPLPLDELWIEYKRIIKDNGAIVLTASQPFTTTLIHSNIEMFRYEWIWIKNRGSNFLHANKMPLKEHENIIVFYNKLPTYNPIKQKRAEMGEQRVKTKIAPSTISKLYGGRIGMQEPTVYSELRFPSSYQKFNTQVGLHPTQKPVALFEYLIKTYTNENDLVLDNCAGSGTTGVACENLNRNSIMMEKEPEYCQIIRDRMTTAEELKLEQRKQTSLQQFRGQTTLTTTSK